MFIDCVGIWWVVANFGGCLRGNWWVVARSAGTGALLCSGLRLCCRAWVGRNRAQRQFRHGGWVSRLIGRPDHGASPFHFVGPSWSGLMFGPLNNALDDWFIGSKPFLKRIAQFARGNCSDKHARLLRLSHAFSIDEIMKFVAADQGVAHSQRIGFPSSIPGRETAALLCRHLISFTVADRRKRRT